MNRIRKINNIYQVLSTPNLPMAPGMEIISGNWEDAHLKGFCVKDYDNLSDAQMDAFSQADIDWHKLVGMHIDFYHMITKKIKSILDAHRFIYEIDTRLMTPDDLKNITFDRVIKFGSRFTLTYDMNDIVNITIINPWTDNLKEMVSILKKSPELNIRNMEVFDGKITHIVGTTPLGTMYEIKLWPTVIHNWAKWQQVNCVKNMEHMKKMYDESLKLQKDIDKGMRIR